MSGGGDSVERSELEAIPAQQPLQAPHSGEAPEVGEARPADEAGQTQAQEEAQTGAQQATYALHVERTGDPDVLRWVGHHPEMLHAAPGPRVPAQSDTSPLAQLMHRGVVTEVFANQHDLLIRKGVNEQWNTLAPILREAIAQEISALPLWLRILSIDTTPSTTTGTTRGATRNRASTTTTPDLVQVQAVVTEAAGAVAQSHGGSIEVVSMAATSITVQMHGACSGCSGTDATLSGLVLQAVRNRWPQFDAVLVDEPAKAPLRSSRWSKINFSKR
jgi:NFU1 iron-sulfur cluster scaffold homolog, mitochondrial